MNNGKKSTELPDTSLAPSAGRTTTKELRPDERREATAEILSEAYALVGDTFDPYHTPQIHALLDQLKELGAVVVDRRDVERWRVEKAEAEVAAANRRRHK